MNNKKTRNKIYHYIDTFFLLAPIIFILFLFAFFLFDIEFTFNSTDSFTTIFNNLISYLFDMFSSVDNYFANLIDLIFDNSNPTSFVYYLSDFLYDLISWFGLMDSDLPCFDFIWFYFIYAICYEFFSLFINIVLWLPRYIRSWIQERGVNV